MSYGWKGINQDSKNLSCKTGISCETRIFPVKQEGVGIENLDREIGCSLLVTGYSFALPGRLVGA